MRRLALTVHLSLTVSKQGISRQAPRSLAHQTSRSTREGACRSPCAACKAMNVSARAGLPDCNAAEASQNYARTCPAGGSAITDCSAAGMNVWWAYCSDQALISHAWRAGDSPSRAIIATARKRDSREGTLLGDMRKDEG